MGACEALLAGFEGTTWALGSILIGLSSLIYSTVMLRSPHFARATAVLGIVASVAGLLFFLPVVGPAASLLATVLGVAWLWLLARDLWRLQQSLPAS